MCACSLIFNVQNLKSGTFVSEPQQSYNATWRAVKPSEPKGKLYCVNKSYTLFVMYFNVLLCV